MKTLLNISNILIIILIASVTTTQAAVTNEIKIERYAVLGAWVLFAITMLVTYLVWRKRTKAIIQHTNKIRTRTYEIMDHGKRVIVTKKLANPKNSKSVA
jgi:hypothetical protein